MDTLSWAAPLSKLVDFPSVTGSRRKTLLPFWQILWANSLVLELTFSRRDFSVPKNNPKVTKIVYLVKMAENLQRTSNSLEVVIASCGDNAYVQFSQILIGIEISYIQINTLKYGDLLYCTVEHTWKIVKTIYGLWHLVALCGNAPSSPKVE